MFEQTNDDSWKQDDSFEQTNAELKRRMMGGANWFFWIAALSLVNSLISLYGSAWSFSLGLGMTRFFDAVGQSAVANGFGDWMKTAVFILNLVIIGLFAAFGYFARQGNMKAFLTGFILYVLDLVAKFIILI